MTQDRLEIDHSTKETQSISKGGLASLTKKDLPTLSKSRFMSGSQCHLRLWNDTHARDLATDTRTSLQGVYDTGHEVGELACKRYPGGHFVAQNHLQFGDALAETQRVLKRGRVSALFEAAFEHEGLIARADIIEQLSSGGWRLIEVKSTTGLKDIFVLDVAFQLIILRAAGIDVRDATVMTLDRSYVYDGKSLDLARLFQLHPVMEQCEKLIDTVGEDARKMQSLISESTPPAIEIGDHCFEPYECPYFAHCSRDVIWPEHGINELPSLHPNRRTELEEAGVEEIQDISDDFPLTKLQRIVCKSVREQQSLVHGDISSMLAKIQPPIRYLDFETFAPAIPRFTGSRAYDAIPFLFSVHTEHDPDTVEHTDYLHEQDDDPRPQIVERLIETLGSEGSICTYSHYEHTVLTSLARAIPEMADELDAISARLFDLLLVVRNSIYHSEFRGSFSIKNVLPVLVLGMGYDDLEISDGQTASVLYIQALKNSKAKKRRKAFDDLRAYCERDTLALARLLQSLRKL